MLLKFLKISYVLTFSYVLRPAQNLRKKYMSNKLRSPLRPVQNLRKNICQINY